MKNKIAKVLGIVLSVTLLASLALVAAPAAAAPGVNEFDDIVLPSDDWEYTDVTILAFNEDGSIIYAAVEQFGDWALVKSTDGGFTWEFTTMDFDWYDDIGSLGDIVDIVVSPADDGFVYVGFGSGKIYKVADEGEGAATVLTQIKNEEGVNATALYDIDVYYDDASGANYVLASTNIDVLVFKDAGLFEEWVPLSLIDFCGPDNIPGGGDDYDGVGVLEAAFAPDFASSSIIWAVFDVGNDNMGDFADADDTYVLGLASTVGTGTWNTVFDGIYFDGDDNADYIGAPWGPIWPVDMAFPTEYTSDDPYLYLALTDPEAGSGDDDGNIFLCVIDENPGGESEADGLLAENDDVCSVDVYGEVILAGTIGYGTELGVYRSDNGGDTFDFIDGPTGQYMAYVYMMPGVFDPDEGTAFCTTSGLGSALSRSIDGGQTWTQIGLLDYSVDEVWDVAFLTQGDVQEAFLITSYGPTVSFWRTEDITADEPQWQRVLSNAPISGNTDYFFMDVEVSLDGNYVMLWAADESSWWSWSDEYSIYKSSDEGWHFSHWRSLPDAVEDINDWIAYDGSTIYCATDGGFYGTSRFGPATTELTSEALASVALQPGFDPDDTDNMTLAVGNYDGEIFVSVNKGEDWGSAFGTLGGGPVYVAFDNDFAVEDADGEGLLYYATGDSVIGWAEVDEDEVIDDDELLDSYDDSARPEWFKGIIVAPDNALYVLGGNEEFDEDYDYYYYASGTIEVAGENQQVDAGAVIQVMSDDSLEQCTLTFADPIDIDNVVGGPFINGEVLMVVGDSLVFDDDDNEITGTIQIQGATSGATGSFAIDDSMYSEDPGLWYWWDAGEPYNDTSVSITSAAMFADVNSGIIEFDEVYIGDYFEDGEMLDITGWSLDADGSGDLGSDDWIDVEGVDSGDDDTVYMDDTGVILPTSGTFDDSEIVDVVSWDLTVDEDYDYYSGWYPTTDDLCRLLLHQDDNIWEYAESGHLEGLWYSEGTNILWSVAIGGFITPTGSDDLIAFEDFLSGPVMGVTATEINKSPSTGTKDISVSWTQLEGAEAYLITALDEDGAGAVAIAGVPSGTDAGDTLTAEIEDLLDPATEYTVMVRVWDGAPYQSRWSTPVTVVTQAQILPPVPEVPANGLQGAPLLPSFVWNAASGAASYDFQLSTSPDFGSLLVDTNVTVTGYTVSSELDYDTDYYWRVRSVASDGTTSKWCSPIQNFHTRTEEIPPVTVEPQPTPQVTVTMESPDITIPDITVQAPDVIVNVPDVVTVTQPPTTTFVFPEEDTGTPVYIWIIVAIGAVLTIAVIVLIIRTRRVV